MRRGVSIQGSILALVLCAVLVACGSSGGGSKTTPPPVVTSVSVTPNPAAVFTGTTQQFMATVAGSGGFSNAVTWSDPDWVI